MNRLITSIIVSFAAIAAMAQDKADVLVSYDSNSTNWQDDDSVRTTRMSLLANARQAKYFNDISLWTDSLKSTPEGKKQWQQIMIAATVTQTAEGMSIDLRKGPVKKVDNYVFTSITDGSLRYYDSFAGEQRYYDEPLDEMQWEICDSTTNIIGYECIMATSDYHGRRWTAWFSPEIPMPFGPWKLHGLPGLILKAEADNGRSFTATGLEQTDRIITPMYSADDYDKTDRRKALADHEYFMNNRESIINAQFGGRVQFSSNADERAPYDALKYATEPDYKESK